MRDKLTDYPGLTPQPMPGTPECDRLQAELEFAIEDVGDPHKAVLRFMIGRGYWPLGTKLKVKKGWKVKAKFPALKP